MSEKERNTLFEHILDIKKTFANYKYVFLDQKLYQPKELVDKIWEVNWFGCHLALQDVVDVMTEKFG